MISSRSIFHQELPTNEVGPKRKRRKPEFLNHNELFSMCDKWYKRQVTYDQMWTTIPTRGNEEITQLYKRGTKPNKVTNCELFFFVWKMGSEGSIVRKPRFLCLHGFRTSAEIMKIQLHKWPKSVIDRLDLVFLDAPFPCQGKSDVEGIFDPPYYEWFQFNKVFYSFFFLFTVRIRVISTLQF